MMQKIQKKLPEILVILLCMIILGVGVSGKEGFHMDELLSFELANAEFNPWIVPTQPEGRLAKFVHNEIDGETLGETLGNFVGVVKDVLQNGGNSRLLTYQADVYAEPAWITGEQFRDYITVDGADDFNYLSVYFNVKDDNHPPIHFMLLHTVSSLFQGAVKPVMGCVINMVAVAFSMALLMAIGKYLAAAFGMEEQGRALGLSAALLYGISTGALASVLLIRMYCVMTCFCVASFYYHVKKWQTGSFNKKNKGLIAVTVLGFLTQYFFLFYCILLAAVTAVLLWCHKRRKELWIYVRSMICAAVIGVGCYPFAVLHVFSSGRGVEALENLSSGLDGYGKRLAAFGSILAERSFGTVLSAVLVIVGAVLFVLWIKQCGKKNAVEKKNNGIALLLLLVFPPTGYFLLAARMSPYQVDRYIMAVFPFVMLMGALVFVVIACYLQKKSGRKYILPLVWGVVLVLQVVRLAGYDGSYLYKGYMEQERVSAEYSGYPCICIYDGVGYYENLLEFANYDKTLLVTQEELKNRQEVQTLLSLKDVVVLMKGTVDEEQMCTILKEKYGLVFKADLLIDSVYGDGVYLFGRG